MRRTATGLWGSCWAPLWGSSVTVSDRRGGRGWGCEGYDNARPYEWRSRQTQRPWHTSTLTHCTPGAKAEGSLCCLQLSVVWPMILVNWCFQQCRFSVRGHLSWPVMWTNHHIADFQSGLLLNSAILKFYITADLMIMRNGCHIEPRLI